MALLIILSLAVLLPYCCIAAAPPTVVAGSVISANPGATLLLPASNITGLSGATKIGRLPGGDPVNYVVPDPVVSASTLVVFWNHILAPQRNEDSIKHALGLALADIPADPDSLIPRFVPRVYECENSIKLYLLSNGDMTWGRWAKAIEAIQAIMLEFDHMNTAFSVRTRGDKTILGTGWIGMT